MAEADADAILRCITLNPEIREIQKTRGMLSAARSQINTAGETRPELALNGREMRKALECAVSDLRLARDSARDPLAAIQDDITQVVDELELQLEVGIRADDDLRRSIRDVGFKVLDLEKWADKGMADELPKCLESPPKTWSESTQTPKALEAWRKGFVGPARRELD